MLSGDQPAMAGQRFLQEPPHVWRNMLTIGQAYLQMSIHPALSPGSGSA